MQTKLISLLICGLWLAGCGPGGSGSANAYLPYDTIEEAQKADDKARDIALDVLPKKAQGQELTEDDKERLQEAIQISESLKKLTPEKFDLYHRLGGIYFALGENEKALQNLQQYIELVPKDEIKFHLATADAYFLAAKAHDHLQQPEEALAAVTKALEFFPETAPYLYMRAQLYERLGQFDKAKADLVTLIKVEPRAQQAKDMLRRLNSQSGS